MVKRTLYFGSPARLNIHLDQLVIKKPNQASFKHTVPIEDIGIVLLDNPQISITHSVMQQLLKNNVAFITCDEKHLPTGLLLLLNGHTKQSQHFRHQVSASEPLKKQLWQQTIVSKIDNQSRHLARLGIPNHQFAPLMRKVQSGDTTNVEGHAAKLYWQLLFQDFTRERFGDYPNNLLNYGYAILRAIVARALTASGLLPTLGIHHRNQYNSYCLADDIMEPYRPYVDALVVQIMEEHGEPVEDLTQDMKAQLLEIATVDTVIQGRRGPLMANVTRTTASLHQCFAGERRKILFPEF